MSLGYPVHVHGRVLPDRCRYVNLPLIAAANLRSVRNVAYSQSCAQEHQGWTMILYRKNARAFPVVLVVKAWVVPLPLSVIAVQPTRSLDHSAP